MGNAWPVAYRNDWAVNFNTGSQSGIGTAKPDVSPPSNQNKRYSQRTGKPGTSSPRSKTRDLGAAQRRAAAKEISRIAKSGTSIGTGVVDPTKQWRALYKPGTAVASRVAASAVLRGAVKFIPYVGAAAAIAEAIYWLYWLFYNLECGHGGVPGDTRTCFGLKQLPLGAAITDYVSPGDTFTNFYEFEKMNGPYEQWRSVGRGFMFNPWVGDGSDTWTKTWPEPRWDADKNNNLFPWEKLDPFNRPPWAPPTEYVPPVRNLPGRRQNPDRVEQSEWGNELPDVRSNPWPIGWPRPNYEGRPFVRIAPRTPGGPPIVVPLPRPPVAPGKPPRPKPEEEGDTSTRPKPRPRPPTGKDPSPRTKPGEKHKRKPPGKKAKERKGGTAAPKIFQKIIGPATEFMDFSKAAFESLPCELQKQLKMAGGRFGRGSLTPDEMALAVYRNWDKVDINDLAYNLAWMQMEDMLIGAASQMESRIRRENFAKYGINEGKSSSSKAGWALKGLQDVEKFLKMTKPPPKCQSSGGASLGDLWEEITKVINP